MPLFLCLLSLTLTKPQLMFAPFVSSSVTVYFQTESPTAVSNSFGSIWGGQIRGWILHLDKPSPAQCYYLSLISKHNVGSVLVLLNQCTRDPGGSESVWDPGHVSLSERPQEVVNLTVGHQLLPVPQALVQLTVRRHQHHFGKEQLFPNRHSALLQMATQVTRLCLEERNQHF